MPIRLQAVEPLPPPATVLLPWESPGFSPEFTSQNIDSLKKSTEFLAKSKLPTSVSLYQYVQRNARVFTQNLRRQIEKITVSEQTISPKINESSYLLPLLCPLEGEIILGLQWGSTLTNEIYGIALQRLGRITNNHSESRIEAAKLSQSLLQLWEKLEQGYRATSPALEALKIGLSLRRGGALQEKGEYLCMNQLMALSLLKDGYRVLGFLGQEQLARIRRSLSQPTGPLRPNRNLSIEWQRQFDKSQIPRYRIFWVLNEAVFGQSRLASQSSSELWSLDQLLQKVTLPPDLSNSLQQEASSLREEDLPAVSHIYGSWVYLDRGRAWGLEVKDRLIGRQDNGKVLKGHIIGFFTKELGLQSPRGFPISEGAILYIRKGREDLKLGQTFDFDPTSFPTPWPPQPTPIDPG